MLKLKKGSFYTSLNQKQMIKQTLIQKDKNIMKRIIILLKDKLYLINNKI